MVCTRTSTPTRDRHTEGRTPRTPTLARIGLGHLSNYGRAGLLDSDTLAGMSGRQPDLFDRAWSAFGDALVAPIRENWRAAGGAAGLVAVLVMLLGFAPAVYLNDMALDI